MHVAQPLRGRKSIRRQRHEEDQAAQGSRLDPFRWIGSDVELLNETRSKENNNQKRTRRRRSPEYRQKSCGSPSSLGTVQKPSGRRWGCSAASSETASSNGAVVARALTTNEQEELNALRRENRSLRLERDILKKATALRRRRRRDRGRLPACPAVGRLSGSGLQSSSVCLVARCTRGRTLRSAPGPSTTWRSTARFGRAWRTAPGATGALE